jgi:hypothetical protein
VKIGGVPYTGAFTYTQATGIITIPAASVIGDIEITGNGILIGYSVTFVGIGASGVSPSGAVSGSEYTGIVSMQTGYDRPSSVTVKIGGVPYTGTFVYTQATGIITIPATAVIGDIEISGNGTLRSYNVTYTGQASNSPTTVNHGTVFNVTLTMNAGYGLPDTIGVKIGGVPYTGTSYNRTTGTISIPGSAVIGDIVIDAGSSLASFTVTYTGNAVLGSNATKAVYMTTYTGTLTMAPGYDRPADITVTVGGVSYTNYTYNQTSGAISIPGADIDGNIVINAIGIPATYTVTVNANGGDVDVILNGTSFTYTSPFTVQYGDRVSLTASHPDLVFYGWSGTVSVRSTTVSFTATTNYNETANFGPVYTEPTYYTITAVADSGSIITPSGSQAVEEGRSITFTFSAKPGYFITDVVIDGFSNWNAVDAGSYTFYKVTSGHMIYVYSEPIPKLTITVDIEGGEGDAEYHIGATDYTKFARIVSIESGSDVYVSLIPADGYRFVNWTGDASGTDIELHYSHLTNSLILVAHLTADESSTSSVDLSDYALILLIIVLIIIAAVLFWLILFAKRRWVDVVKIEGGDFGIIGKDKTRRKKPYVFALSEWATVKYHIGEKGEWKSPIERPDGKLEIPGEDVTDTITISTQ